MICVCVCVVQDVVKSELCELNNTQFQLLADELRDQILNVSVLPIPTCTYICTLYVHVLL